MLNKEHIDIPIPVLRYSLAFAGLYFVVLAGFGIVTYFIEFDLGQGANIGALVAALYFAVHLFVQDNGCAPSKTERKRLSWACLLSSVIVSLAIISVLLMFEGQSLLSVLSEISETVSPVLLSVVAIVMLFIYKLAISWLILSFGGRRKKHYKN